MTIKDDNCIIMLQTKYLNQLTYQPTNLHGDQIRVPNLDVTSMVSVAQRVMGCSI